MLIVDEAQDMSRLQWNLVKALESKADRTFIAGDDDQAVFNWAGADVQSFLSHEGEVKVLKHSYRVPAEVHDLADRIVNRIQNRQAKTWTPREEQGEIHCYNDEQLAEFEESLKNGEKPVLTNPEPTNLIEA